MGRWRKIIFALGQCGPRAVSKSSFYGVVVFTLSGSSGRGASAGMLPLGVSQVRRLLPRHCETRARRRRRRRRVAIPRAIWRGGRRGCRGRSGTWCGILATWRCTKGGRHAYTQGVAGGATRGPGPGPNPNLNPNPNPNYPRGRIRRGIRHIPKGAWGPSA